MASVTSFFSALFTPEPVFNDAPPESEPVKDDTEDQDSEKEEEEEEEEEPEDPAPALREECANTAACAPFNTHFVHCTEKVTEGKGFAHEDCVEELFHLMHCVDNCIAPRLFSKLA